MIAALEGFTRLRLDVYRQDAAARMALEELRVPAIPALIFLDAEGREVRRMVGLESTARILEAVRQTLGTGPR